MSLEGVSESPSSPCSPLQQESVSNQTLLDQVHSSALGALHYLTEHWRTFLAGTAVIVWTVTWILAPSLIPALFGFKKLVLPLLLFGTFLAYQKDQFEIANHRQDLSEDGRQLPALSHLGYNLSQILEAAKEDPSNEEVRLTADLYPNFLLSTPNINYVKKGSLFFRLYDSWKKDSREDKIQEAFRFTHKLFHDYLALSESIHLPAYRLYLMRKCSGENCEDYAIRDTANFILRFYTETHEFIRSAKNKHYDRIIALFKKGVFCKDCLRSAERVERYYHVINITSKLGRSIPYELIHNAALGNHSGDSDEWTNFINDCLDSNITARDLHKGLRALVRHFRDEHDTNAYKLTEKIFSVACLESTIEISLETINAQLNRKSRPLFMELDPIHMAWKDSLKEGSFIKSACVENIEGQYTHSIHEITLGKQVGKKEEGYDHNVYFEVAEYYISKRKLSEGEQNLEDYLELPEESTREKQDASQILLWVNINEAVIGIKQERFQYFYLLGYPDIKFQDNGGKFALVEKLTYPQSDQEKCRHKDVIINFINEIIKSRNLPSPLHPQYLMFTSDTGTMKSVKLLDERPFDFVDLERFIYEVSDKDPETFKKIMESSIHRHKEASIIQEAVLTTFEPDKFDVVNKVDALGGDLLDRDLLSKAQKLREEMQQLYTNACASILLKLKKGTLSSIEKKDLQDILLGLYKRSGGVTFFWPDLVKETVKSFQNE